VLSGRKTQEPGTQSQAPSARPPALEGLDALSNKDLELFMKRARDFMEYSDKHGFETALSDFKISKREIGAVLEIAKLYAGVQKHLSDKRILRCL
jgi:hypothetical protein